MVIGRWRNVFAALALAVLAFVPGSVQAQDAGTGGGSFSGVASSQLVSVNVGATPAVVLDPLLDPGITQAQAAVDSLGTSSAYARSVFPGTLYEILPGFGALLTPGQALPVPPNPLQIATAYPSARSAEASAGTIAMKASSTATRSAATVTNATDQAKATVEGEPDTGKVTATAEGALSEVKLADLIVLNGLRSTARAERSAGSDLQRESSLTLAAITVAGQRIALAPGSLDLLGSVAELPLVSPVRTLLASLSALGIQMDYVPAVELPDGIQSAALRISFSVRAPAELGLSGVESLGVSLTVGGAIATASASNFGDDDGESFDGPTVAPTLDVVPTDLPGDVAFGEIGGDAPSVPSAVELPGRPAASYVVPGIRTSVAALYPIVVLAAALLYGLTRVSSHLRGERR